MKLFRNRFINTATLFTLCLGLFACGSSGDGAGPSISVIAVSGATITLDGEYKSGCLPVEGGGGFNVESLTVSGNIVIATTTDYGSDSTCTTSTDLGTFTATIAVDGANSAITGWVDGTGSDSPPPEAAGGSGPLSNTEPFTPLTLTITAITGSKEGDALPTFKIFFIIDNTGTANVLYFDHDFDNGDTRAGTDDPSIEQ